MCAKPRQHCPTAFSLFYYFAQRQLSIFLRNFISLRYPQECVKLRSSAGVLPHKTTCISAAQTPPPYMETHMNALHDPAPTDLRRMPTVSTQVSLSAATIYRLVAAGQFPRPVKIGARASAFIGREIDEWIAARVAQRDARCGKRHVEPPRVLRGLSGTSQLARPDRCRQ